MPGIDGSQVDRKDWVDFNERSFRRNNGRTVLLGEYGCYCSQLGALSDFLETGQPIGFIVEDDIELGADLVVRTQAAFDVCRRQMSSSFAAIGQFGSKPLPPLPSGMKSAGRGMGPRALPHVRRSRAPEPEN